MKNIACVFPFSLLICTCGLGPTALQAGDWPQWRGANRDARATDFASPETWPKELNRKWKVTVGEGVATPALVGDKLYVFSRQEGNEVTRCLDAGSGTELWQDKYESGGATGPAQGFSGPRSCPAVANGKVITYGVRGVLSCLDAAKGTRLWRKDDFPGAYPRFHPSSSPMIVDKVCIAQVGGPGNGGLYAYDLASGDVQWKWDGDAPAYASPVLMNQGGTKLVIAMTERKIVALNAADGKLVWETPFAPSGMGGYNAATPLVDGTALIFSGSGRGVKAVQLIKQGDAWTGKELWSNEEKSVQFNTPVLTEGFLYGITGANGFFCLSARDGKTVWSAPVAGTNAEPASGGERPGGGRGGRGGGRSAGYGSIVDAGQVLLALTPASELIVFKPDAKAYEEVARIKVADSQTYAYPVVTGNRIFIKDANEVTLWTLN